MNWLHEMVTDIVREALTRSLTMPSSGYQICTLRTEADDSISGGESPRRLKSEARGTSLPT